MAKRNSKINKKRNPKVNINKLIRGKYYILEENIPSLVRPEYKAIIFNYYNDNEVVGFHPRTFKLMSQEYSDIDKIYGPFNSREELIDYAYRLKPGKWMPFNL